MKHLHIGTAKNCCVIADTDVNNMATSPFGQSQRLLVITDADVKKMALQQNLFQPLNIHYSHR